MAKNDNTILWAIGIIAFLIIASNLNIFPQFAIIQKTVCVDNTISYWDADGNVLDSQGLNDGTNHGARFITGKSSQALEFNKTTYVDFPTISNSNATVMWIKNYSRGDANYFFLARIKGINYVNTIQDSSKQIIPVGPGFGLGLNGSVDIIGVFSDLNTSAMVDLYNNGNSREICYTTSYEENVTCKDYAASQVTDTGTGCLNYTGTYFPACSYSWEATTYKVVNNACQRQFYCEDGGLTLSECQAKLTPSTSSTTTSTSTAGVTTTSAAATAPVEETGLNKEIFEVGGYKIRLLHLLILLAVVVVILFVNRKNG